MIEAIATAGELSFVRSEAHFANSPPAEGLWRRLRHAGARPLVPAAPAAGHYVLLGDVEFGDNLWGALWDLRTEQSVHTAFAERVLPQCPLLSAERGRGVVSPIGLQAPVGSAWICMGIDLASFAGRGGAVDERALKRCLEACVDVNTISVDIGPLDDNIPQVNPDAQLNLLIIVHL